MWELLRKRGSDSRRGDAPKSFFPFYLSSAGLRIPSMSWESALNQWLVTEAPAEGEIALWPIDENGVERRWRWGLETAKQNVSDLRVVAKDGTHIVYYKYRQPEGILPTTNWISSEYSSTEHGTGLLKHYFTDYQAFSYPKSLFAVRDCLGISGAFSDKNALCLDFFAGSGTTGHAVIELNRNDDGNRSYVMVEQGSYFETILKPRMQKVVYASDWKEGKPTAPETGISHAFKVLKIEGYEDTLNNLDLKRSDAQANLLNELGEAARDDYLMRYMLDVEAKGSLLSVSDFRKPFDYTLKVAIDSAGAWEERKVDLVETFNYLIGLTVRHIDIQAKQGFVTVEGWLPTGEKTLILWRDCEKIGYEELTRLCDKLKINPADSEFDLVYINGDHNIPSVVENTEEEGSLVKKLMLRQIEPAFLDAMFNVDDV